VVIHRSTDLAICSLDMAERTGCLVFYSLWLQMRICCWLCIWAGGQYVESSLALRLRGDRTAGNDTPLFTWDLGTWGQIPFTLRTEPSMLNNTVTVRSTIDPASFTVGWPA